MGISSDGMADMVFRKRGEMLLFCGVMELRCVLVSSGAAAVVAITLRSAEAVCELPTCDLRRGRLEKHRGSLEACTTLRSRRARELRMFTLAAILELWRRVLPDCIRLPEEMSWTSLRAALPPLQPPGLAVDDVLRI